MAVKGVADRVVFYNYNQPTATPPIVFQDFTDSSQFSYCIWAKILDTTTPDVLHLIQGTLGSQILIEMGANASGFTWEFVIRSTSVQFFRQTIAQIPVGKWCLFYVTKNLQFIDVLYGVEDGSGAPVPVTHAIQAATTPGFSLIFDHIAFVARNNMAVCNFKYWNTLLSFQQVAEQTNRWDTLTPVHGGPTPMWCSTLRTPGDISNIANPNASPNWELSHQYTVITPNVESLRLESDPLYLNTQPCPTWLYPPVGTGFVFHNPGTTPVAQTTYKSAIHFVFIDKGSIPEVIPSIAEYYAYPFTTGTGIGPVSSWPLYTDENAVELVTDLGNPANRFEVDTGVAIPLPHNNVVFYSWFFGAQFTWAGSVPQPAATGNVGYPHLLITYTGIPTGRISLPIQDLVGLFAIRRDGQAVDQYNRGVKLKIPDPTIRTAFLGE